MTGQGHKGGFLDVGNTWLLDLGAGFINLFSLGASHKLGIYDM